MTAPFTYEELRTMSLNEALRRVGATHDRLGEFEPKHRVTWPDGTVEQNSALESSHVLRCRYFRDDYIADMQEQLRSAWQFKPAWTCYPLPGWMARRAWQRYVRSRISALRSAREWKS